MIILITDDSAKREVASSADHHIAQPDIYLQCDLHANQQQELHMTLIAYGSVAGSASQLQRDTLRMHQIVTKSYNYAS